MKKILLIFLLIACIKNFAQDSENKWVYVEYHVPDDDSLFTYHFYGQIKNKIYRAIERGKFKNTFFVLENVRYFDEKYIPFEDEEDVGTLIFKTDFVVRIVPRKQDPLNLNKKAYPKAESSKNLVRE